MVFSTLEEMLAENKHPMNLTLISWNEYTFTKRNDIKYANEFTMLYLSKTFWLGNISHHEKSPYHWCSLFRAWAIRKILGQTPFIILDLEVEILLWWLERKHCKPMKI
jgi:hypothetical protein